MLALTALTLSHFRSHLRADLHLDGRPVAIHGANGAGKTNILEAVSLFSPGRGLRRASAADMARRPEELGWKLRAELRAGRQTYEVETWSEAGKARLTCKTAFICSQCQAKWVTTAMPRGHKNRGAFTPQS